ncbi:MAG: ATP-binding protein [Phycisphaerales bacterium]
MKNVQAKQVRGGGPSLIESGPTGPAELSLELRSNPLFLSAAREMVAAVTKRLGFPDEAAGQVALAVDEALCNVIRHGYNRDPHRPIWIRVFPEGNGWGQGACGGGCDGRFPTHMRIVIEDEAHQVDPTTIKSRDLAEVRPGGLGVHIIQSVMDEAKYEKREGVGMRLTMVKVRREPAGEGGAPSALAADERGWCGNSTAGGANTNNPGEGSGAGHG